MQPFFTPPGEQALRGVMQRRPILAFDFDGTLAPIVAHPDDVKVPDVISRGLTRLARRHPVAIITGRAVADVRPRLGFTPQYVIGNHGAEDPDAPGPAITGATLDPLRLRASRRRRRCARPASRSRTSVSRSRCTTGAPPTRRRRSAASRNCSTGSTRRWGASAASASSTSSPRACRTRAMPWSA